MSENNPIPDGVKHLLIVEGDDELDFFVELAKHMYSDIPYHIVKYDGAEKFETAILPLPNNPNFSAIKSIGIIRDADYGINAFERIKSALERVNEEIGDARLNYPVPDKPHKVVGNKLKLSIFIMPDNQTEGMLENLIINALNDDELMPCVKTYFECIQETGITIKPEPLPKATLNVYMAARYQEEMRILIEGKKVDMETSHKDKKRRYLSDIYRMTWWDWNHAAFDDIKTFIRQLVDLADSQE